MTNAPRALQSTKILWTVVDWRCEVHASERLVLYRGDDVVAEHRASSHVHVHACADVWRAAIEDVFKPTGADENAPDGADADMVQLWTDADGYIRDVTDTAARLLNISPRLALRRRIQVFFLTERQRVARLVEEAARGHASRLPRAVLRPRERRQMSVSAILEPDRESGLVRWTLMVPKARRDRSDDRVTDR